MPSLDAHQQAARDNQRFLDHLLSSAEEFPAWIAVVAFYKAVHLVEALFSVNDGHSLDHRDREQNLKATRYSHIWKNYRELKQAALIARYLRGTDEREYQNFTDYMPCVAVKSLLVGHHLRQVEKSVEGFLATS